MIYSVLKLKLKQVIGLFGPVSVLKFLAPDFLLGAFMALSMGNKIIQDFEMRAGAVICGIALFTLIVETRKLFFSGGDLEDFYFTQPTMISRFANLSTIMLLDLTIILSVMLPVVFLTFSDPEFLMEAMSISLSAFCISIMSYLVLLLLLASLPAKIADFFLTIIQIIMALILLVVFQLPFILKSLFKFVDMPLAPYVMILAACVLFLIFPFQEKLLSRFKDDETRYGKDMTQIIERARKILFIKSDEEEAGFLFFVSNIFRNRSFRLSTIGIAATPVMVTIYWILRGFHFVKFGLYPGLVGSEFVAPLASLITSGIIVNYFLSQNLLSSKDHEGSWVFKFNHEFSAGKFVLGIRKSLLLMVHIPMTFVIFLVIIQRDSLFESSIAALTFYFLTHIAISFFSIMQKDFPFTLPFTKIGSQGVIDLTFLLFYSFLITFALFISCVKVERLLALNLIAFILVEVLEIFSVGIIDKRLKLSV